MKHWIKFQIMQFKFGRKLLKGKFYNISPRGLCMGSFWSDYEITSCQSVTLKTEKYD